MRGEADRQSDLFSYVSLESRIPAAHPIRAIKALADGVVEQLDELFTSMYSALGRPSIPPERLLKSLLLMALFSVRSERQFCEQLEYNLLFRWFLDLGIDDPGFHATSFTKNRDRLFEHDVAGEFFRRVLGVAKERKLLSEEHFSVDGTLIEAWGSMKSVKPKDGPDDTDSNGWADFKGQKRSNETHASKTDPDSRLARKGRGKETKLSDMAHALSENRSGLVVDIIVTPSTGKAERQAAEEMLDDLIADGARPKTVGADAGYDVAAFLDQLRDKGVTPHVARNRRTSSQPESIAEDKGYQVSQIKRRRIEQVFSWVKKVALAQRSRYRGRDRTALAVTLATAAYNLIRIARLPARGRLATT